MNLLRHASSLKHKIDAKISKQRGTFLSRTPKEAYDIFGLEFDKQDKIKNLELGDSKLDKLSVPSQGFLVGAFSKYASTFPEGQNIGKTFDSFQGNESNMKSQIDFYLRCVVMAGYDSGVYISSDEPFVTLDGKYKGNHDLVVFKKDLSTILCRYAKEVEGKKFHPIELAQSGIVFELYEHYWKNPQSDVYGCVSDLNNWIFLKYDGNQFYRTHRVFKLALHNTAIVSLAIKILNILDAKPLIY